MKVMCTILICIVLLFTVTILAACPPAPPPADKISAKEAWSIIEPAKKTVSDDTVPVYIEGSSTIPEIKVKEGKAPVWDVGFYSESDNSVWEVHYFAKSDSKVTPLPGEKCYSDVSLTANDLEDWKADSPEACEIAAKNGALKTVFMVLRIARLESLSDSNLFKTPEFIPESAKLIWVIEDEKSDYYYIDACTGEYLGSLTGEQLNKTNK